MIKNVPKSKQCSSWFLSGFSSVKSQIVLPKACLPNWDESCAERENDVSKRYETLSHAQGRRTRYVATAMIKNVPKSNQSSSCFTSKLPVVKLQTILPKACLPDLNKPCAERENDVSSWCCCSLRLLCLQRQLFVFLAMELLLVAL